MLLRGSKAKARQQLKDEFDRLNAQVAATSYPGVIGVTIQTTRANLPAVLTLLEEVLRTPSFPEAEFEILKREKIEALEKSSTDPTGLALNRFLGRVNNDYPADDVRYKPTTEERIASNKAVTRDQVKNLFAEQVGGRGQLAIVGDFDAATAVQQVRAIVEGWTAKVPYRRIERPAQPGKGGTERILTPDKSNAIYVAGLALDLSDQDPDYPAMVVGNYILGAAPLASRLNDRVRGKEGLSYSVGSSVVAFSLDKGGFFLMSAITNPKNMEKVDATIGEELNKFLTEGVSASELEEAKKAYIQKQRVLRGNDSTLASELGRAMDAGRTFEYYADLEKKIEALQPGDVKKAFDSRVRPKDLIVIQAGDLPKEKK
jgi:zinc protease